MRDIKFKCWQGGVMYVVVCIWYRLGRVGHVVVEDPNNKDDITTLFPEYGEILLLQFTGLHDKHGNEIYDGDILKRSKELEPSFVAVIEFKNGMFGGTTKPYNNHFIEMPRLNKCDYGGGGYDEIIGNIYEYPSLLNQ